MAADFFSYQNPIYHPAIEAIRDCQILPYGGRYYLTGTCPPFWRGENAGVRLYSSADLLDWRDEGLLITRDTLSPHAWCRDRFWAPELHAIGERIFLTFNCRNDATGFPQSCGIATADTPTGPYTIHHAATPLVEGANDLTLFEDADGRVYAYYAVSGMGNWHSILGCEFCPRTFSLRGTPVVCLERQPHAWDSIGIEGPYVVRREGRYYLFYSSWTRGYEIGYATASSPLGPFTKAAENPFFGAQDEEACRRNQATYQPSPKSPYIAVGHNAIFTGPDGGDWLVCHYQERNGAESLGFDPVEIAEGRVTSRGPSYTRQQIPLHPLKARTIT